MERNTEKQLLEWKNDKDRKPLIITGLRQCGKTWVIKRFGEKYFDNTIYFNFEKNGKLNSIFDYDLDVKRILKELELQVDEKIIIGKTLLIFDEIQNCPKALTSLKYFCEDFRKLHIIAAGSLLGVAITTKDFSFPVGKVDRLEMFPMSFEEFLIAQENGKKLHDAVLNYDLSREIPEIYTSELKKLLKEYYVVGGLPEAVNSFRKYHDIQKVEKIQSNILRDYSDDFSKYAPTADFPKLHWIWDSVPVQLARENNKFIFSHVKEGKRSTELEDALEWLFGAGLVKKLECVQDATLPLSSHSDATNFKVYMADVGLLRVKAKLDAKTVFDETPLYNTFKGAFTENFVMTELLQLGLKPYFWRSGNTAELDFIFEDKNILYPIEAKANLSTKAKSYSLFCKKYSPKTGFKFSLKNCAVNNVEGTKTFSLPLYLMWRLGKKL